MIIQCVWKMRFIKISTIFLIIHCVCGFDQTYFTKLKIVSVLDTIIHTNFTTKSRIACTVACKTFEQTCTHAVIRNLDNNIVQCTLIAAGNRTNQLHISGDGSKLWAKGKENDWALLCPSMSCPPPHYSGTKDLLTLITYIIITTWHDHYFALF